MGTCIHSNKLFPNVHEPRSPKFLNEPAAAVVMAGHSFSLPNLKLTKHKKRKIVLRTLQKKSSSCRSEQQLLEFESFRENDGLEVPHLEEPSIHEFEMKAAAIGWGQIKGKMPNAVVETVGMLLISLLF